MKQIVNLLSILILVSFIGCGGGDGGVQPPPAPAGVDAQTLNDLFNSANKTVQDCSKQYTAVFSMLAVQMNQQRAAGQQINVPVIPQQAAANGPCNNDIANLLMLFSTIRVPQPGNPDTLYAYLPEAKEWLVRSVGKSLINSVGASLQAQGIQMTPEITQSLMAAAIQNVNQNVRPVVGTTPQANTTISQVGSTYGVF